MPSASHNWLKQSPPQTPYSVDDIAIAITSSFGDACASTNATLIKEETRPVIFSCVFIKVASRWISTTINVKCDLGLCNLKNCIRKLIAIRIWVPIGTLS